MTPLISLTPPDSGIIVFPVFFLILLLFFFLRGALHYLLHNGHYRDQSQIRADARLCRVS
jgi:hypothetical protein